MAKTALARSGENRGEGIQALGIGTTQAETTIGAAATVWFVDTGSAPDASTGNRMALAPDTGHYLKVAGGDKVAVHDGTAGGTFTNAVGADTTVVWVYYDSTAGTAYLTEMT